MTISKRRTAPRYACRSACQLSRVCILTSAVLWCRWQRRQRRTQQRMERRLRPAERSASHLALAVSHRRREAHPLLPLPPLSGMRCPRRTRQRSCRLWRGRSPVPGSRCVALLSQTACPVSPSTCATLTGACSSRHRRIRPPIQRLHRCKAMRRQLGCVSHRSSRPRQFLSHPAPIMTCALCVFRLLPSSL